MAAMTFPLSALCTLLLPGLVLALGQPSAQAQPSSPPPPPPPPLIEASAHSTSLTLSPIHLAIGVVELTGEFRLADKLGLAGTLGGGRVDGLSVYEVGAQLNYYLTGSFDGGLHIGAEVQFISAFNDPDETFDMQTTATAEGLAVGPMLGWKWIGDSGFSFVAQGGVQYMAVQARAESGTVSASDEDSRIGPLVNLNAGWSF
jgi:hypothetical protein